MLSMKILIIAAVLVIPVGVIVHYARESAQQAAPAQRKWAPLTQPDTRRTEDVQLEWQRQQDSKRFRPLIEQVEPYVETCRRKQINPKTLQLSGKVVVWDLEEQRLDEAQGYLPMNLRGSPEASELTIFLIVQRDRQRMSQYEGFIPGYRLTLSVCVFTLPERKPLGMVEFEGDPPPRFLPARSTGKSEPVYGDVSGPLARWIMALPRGRGK